MQRKRKRANFKNIFHAREVVVATSRHCKKSVQMTPYIYEFLSKKLVFILYMGVSLVSRVLSRVCRDSRLLSRHFSLPPLVLPLRASRLFRRVATCRDALFTPYMRGMVPVISIFILYFLHVYTNVTMSRQKKR